MLFAAEIINTFNKCPLKVDWSVAIQAPLFSLVGFSNLFINVLLISLSWRMSSMPGSLRLLLCSIFFGHMLMSVFCFELPLYIIAAWFVDGFDNLRMSPVVCAIITSSFPIGGVSATIGLTLVSVDRALACWNKWNRRITTVGFVLIGWLVGISTGFSAVIFPSDKPICFCHPFLAKNAHLANVEIGLTVAYQLASLFLSIMVYRWSKGYYELFGINQAMTGLLKRRWQLFHCMRSTRAVIAITLLELSTVSVVLILWGIELRRNPSDPSANIFLIGNFGIIFYSMAFPLIILKKNKNLHKILEKYYPKINKFLISIHFVDACPDVFFSNGIISFHADPEEAQCIVEYFWHKQASIESTG